MYSIVDIESNGAGFRKESIIEIAIYQFDGHKITDQFISLVNPEDSITPFVQKLTGISPKMVKTAPKFYEIAKRIIEITENTTLVGHNVEFDYRMLRQSFQRLGYKFQSHYIDTIPLAKQLFPSAQEYALGKLCKNLGIALSNQHRASGDARATLDLFKMLMNKDLDNQIIQKHYEQTNENSFLNKIRQLTEDLPSESGIVFFQNDKGNILYTKFTENINKFSKKLLQSKIKKHQKLQTEIHGIQYELTGSALIAKLILLSKNLVRKEQKPYTLVSQNGKYAIAKSSSIQSKDKLIQFKSYTQALKVLSFINQSPEFQQVEFLIQKIDLCRFSGFLKGKGRTHGEFCFIQIQRGTPVAFGFYEFYNQVQTEKIRNSLKIDIKTNIGLLSDELKLALLGQEFQILTD